MLFGTCKMIRQDGFLGKKIYSFDVPYDIIKLAKKYKKTFLGLGKWKNSNVPYLCLYRPGDKLPFYFHKDTLKDMLKQMGGKDED